MKGSRNGEIVEISGSGNGMYLGYLGSMNCVPRSSPGVLLFIVFFGSLAVQMPREI